MIEEIIPLAPIHFFSIGADLDFFEGKKGDRLPSKYLLPDLTSHFYEESPFADVSAGWNEKGIFIAVTTAIVFNAPQFPNVRDGDSIELFFDTRDVKNGPITKFCHHFCFLAEPHGSNGESVQALEMTKFRGDDSHPIAPPELLFVTTEKRGKETEIRIFIPKEVLWGYDPAAFNRLGFTYRINRANDSPQFFSQAGLEVSIEQYPSYWASLTMRSR